MRLRATAVKGSMSGRSRTKCVPFVTTTLELRTCDLLVELLPVCKLPSKDFELFHVVAKIGHVLSRECFI